MTVEGTNPFGMTLIYERTHSTLCFFGNVSRAILHYVRSLDKSRRGQHMHMHTLNCINIQEEVTMYSYHAFFLLPQLAVAPTLPILTTSTLITYPDQAARRDPYVTLFS